MRYHGKLELDLYLPPGDPAPLVVFVHGGGWAVGSRTTLGPSYPGQEPFERIAREGLAVASVDYRLSGEAIWPAALNDVRAAVRWLREYDGVDSSRIALWGESAGGHLASLVGLTDPSIAAVAAWYTPSDLGTVGADPSDPDSREARFLGGPVADLPERVREASPLHHAHPDAPPFLLLHGSADRFVPVEQSERFAAALPDVELELYDDADHLWRGTPSVAAAALGRTIEFLRKNLLEGLPRE